MKRKNTSIMIVIIMLITITTPILAAGEDFQSFSTRMKNTYGVTVISSINVTKQSQDFIEASLAFFGADFMKKMCSIWSEKSRRDVYINIQAKKGSLLGKTVVGKDHASVVLYEGFPSSTTVHEIMHIVLYTLDMFEDRAGIRNKITSYNEGRGYDRGGWAADDNLYFAYIYGKKNPADDIATIAGSVFADRDGVFLNNIKTNKAKAIRFKWQYMKELTGKYIAPSPMFDVLGSNDAKSALKLPRKSGNGVK